MRRESRRASRGVRAHRAPLAPEGLARRLGIPVTAPARTLVDLASVVPARIVRRTTSQALALRLTSVAEIVAALRRAGPWRGRQVLAGIVARRAGADP
jgi:hypothetical protein